MMATHEIKPSFGIYRADGSKSPTLRKAFVVPGNITQNDLDLGYVTLRDGTKWELIVEDAAKFVIKADMYAHCIISYQVHAVDGEQQNFAVARLYAPKRPTND